MGEKHAPWVSQWSLSFLGVCSHHFLLSMLSRHFLLQHHVSTTIINTFNDRECRYGFIRQLLRPSTTTSPNIFGYITHNTTYSRYYSYRQFQTAANANTGSYGYVGVKKLMTMKLFLSLHLPVQYPPSQKYAHVNLLQSAGIHPIRV